MHPTKVLLFVAFSLSSHFIANCDSSRNYGYKKHKETLQLTQVLFRHGDRNPIWKYKNDPYLNEPMFFSDEMGELTNVGKVQHYELGSFLRHRYDGFLSRNYSRNEIMIQSSDADRCIMSAEMNLAGLYMPEHLNTNWDSKVQWTPTPLRTIPRSMDKILGMGQSCAKYDRLRTEIRNSEEVTKFNKENSEFTDYISRHSGVEANEAGDIVFIHDILTVEQAHGYKLPNWTNGIMDKFAYLAGMDLKLHTATKEIQRLRGGPLLNEFLGNMKERVQLSYSKKFYMYSAHDSTVAYFLNALGVFDPVMPTYASAVIVELHKDVDNEYFVEVFFRNETNREPYHLEIPQCSSPCYFNTFINITKPVIAENWEEECKDMDLDPMMVAATSPMTRMFIVMFAIVISMSTMVFMISKKKVTVIIRQPAKSKSSSTINISDKSKSCYESI